MSPVGVGFGMADKVLVQRVGKNMWIHHLEFLTGSRSRLSPFQAFCFLPIAQPREREDEKNCRGSIVNRKRPYLTGCTE